MQSMNVTLTPESEKYLRDQIASGRFQSAEDVVAAALRRMQLGDAMAIRAEWMKLVGIPDDEVAELCNPQLYPGNVAEELQNLEAAKSRRQQSLTSEQLDELARTHRPPADWR
jgi:putative addiction module CopG family antidote